eukprot:g3389.t1
MDALLEEFPASVEQADELAGRLPLHWMCRNYEMPDDLVEDVIQRYANAVKVYDETGMLPLHVACETVRPKESLIRLLLKEFPDSINMRDRQSNALPVEFACKARTFSKGVVRALLENAPTEHFEPALAAAKEGATSHTYYQVLGVIRAIKWEQTKLMGDET